MYKLYGLFLLLLLSVDVKASTFNSIYGTDNRKTYSEFNTYQKDLASSVAALVSEDKVEDFDLNFIDFKAPTLIKSLNLCSYERFSSKSMLSDCTGFLVDDDLIMTAGHCYKNISDCENKVWVFDYNESSKDKIQLENKNVYSCKEIVDSRDYKVGKNYIDYALIRLDRKVVGRDPLRVKHLEYIKPSNDLIIIGHPLGLAKTLVDDFPLIGKFSEVNSKINSDTFFGNSGSPVIDQDSGLVVGMLIRGENDFIFDYENNCNKIKRCLSNTCKGEQILNFKGFPLKHIPFHY